MMRGRNATRGSEARPLRQYFDGAIPKRSYRGSLENCLSERTRGFESLSLRNFRGLVGKADRSVLGADAERRMGANPIVPTIVNPPWPSS